MACDLRQQQEPVSRLPRPQLAIAVLALGGMIAGFVLARSAAEVSPPAPVAVVVQDDVAPVAPDPAWVIDGAPIERIGYRQGRRQALEVVPLGPLRVEVEVRTAQAFLAMRAAAEQAGVELGLVSGFRTAAEQRALHRAWRKGHGNKAALPGRSNHQSGRALDIGGVTAPGALAWLETNAALFGFKRTVKGEPWHWEYVEIPIARAAAKPRKKAKHVAGVGHARRPARHGAATTRDRLATKL